MGKAGRVERDREKEERKFGCWLVGKEVEPCISFMPWLLFEPNWLLPSSPVLPTLLKVPTTSFASLAAAGWIVRRSAGARRPPSLSRRPPMARERE